MDNNIFLSEVAGRFCTQGIALVHNLIAGSFVYVGNGSDNGSKVFPSPRYTPYHVPHRTEINGFMTILHGDARFYNNVFVQQPVRQLLVDYAKDRKIDRLDLMNYIVGTKPYDGYPGAEEYFAGFQENNYKIREERDKYYDHLPVYSGGNVYFNGAQPYDGEKDYMKDTEHHIELELVEKDGDLILYTNLFRYMPKTRNSMISTKLLGEAFEPEELFENPDGSPITFDEDYTGKHRLPTPVSGPFEIYEEVASINL